MSQPIRDQWAQWVLQRGHGGDPEQQQRVLAELAPVRDPYVLISHWTDH